MADNSNNASLFDIRKHRTSHSRKFNTSVDEYQVTFNTPAIVGNDIVETLAGLHEAFEQLFDELLQGFPPNTWIRIVVFSNSLGTEINLPYVAVGDFDAEVLYQAVQRTLNSQESFQLDESFRVHIMRTEAPGGSGRVTREDKLMFDKWLLKKKTVIKIPNTDTLCLARSIVVAIEAMKGTFTRMQFQRFVQCAGGNQTVQAIKLHQDANIPLDEPSYDLAAVHAFQMFLKEEYALHVTDKFSDHLYNGNAYAGDVSKLKHLYLLLHNNHYYPIRSMKAYRGTDYYCDACQKPSKSSIHFCECTCSSCHVRKCKNRLTRSEETFTCSKCKVELSTEDCLVAHSCGQMIKCGACSMYYQRHLTQRHEQRCGKWFCKICKEHFPLPRDIHFCFVQKIKPPVRLEEKTQEVESAEDNEMVEGENDEEKEVKESVASSAESSKEDVLCFYDIETIFVDEGYHRANLVVLAVQDEVMVFEGPEPIAEFIDAISTLRQSFKRRLLFIAHNASGFDNTLVLNGFYRQGLKPKNIIYRGSKILMMEFSGRIRFLCSYLFITQSLRSIAKDFQLDQGKLHFPILINTHGNTGKTIPFPDIADYHPNSMSEKGLAEFMKVYRDERNAYAERGELFDVSKELRKYCIQDVKVLRDALTRFSTEFEELTHLKPFSNGITLPSVCMKLYRMYHLPSSEMIPIIPSDGLETKTRFSHVANIWLLYEQEKRGIYIQGAQTGREVTFGSSTIDGYSENGNKKMVFEFYGCLFHSCPKHYSDPNGVNPICKLTHREVRWRGEKKRKALLDRHVEIVEMWECEFKDLYQDKETSAALRRIDSSFSNLARMVPRDGLYGGRVECFTLYAEHDSSTTLNYFDFVSLYPTVMIETEYSIGQPKVVYGFQLQPDFDVRKTRGLFRMRILPPRNLLVALLPYRTNKFGLVFALCRSCADIASTTTCTHIAEERALTGVWSHIEVNAALDEGYIIEQIYEMYVFENSSDQLFKSYIDTFIGQKIINGGYPHRIVTEDDKDAYVRSVSDRIHQQVTRDMIKKNPVKKQASKLCLNNLWGKFCQNTKPVATKICNEPAEFFDLFHDKSIRIVSYYLLDEGHAMHVNYERLEDTGMRGSTGLMVAIETTAAARVKLFKLLKEIGGHRLIYCDTDSVIFKSGPSDLIPPTGDFMGNLQNEIEEKFSGGLLTRVVALGSKSYALEIADNKGDMKYVIHCKGLTLNVGTRNIVTFDTMLDLLHRSRDGSIQVDYPYSMRRCKKKTKIYSVHRKKILQFTFRKRLVDFENYETHPLGYKADAL